MSKSPSDDLLWHLSLRHGAIFCMAFLITNWISLSLLQQLGNISPYWLANAVALYGMLRYDTVSAAWILLLSGGLNLTMSLLFGYSADVSVLLAVANVVETLFLALVLRKGLKITLPLQSLDRFLFHFPLAVALTGVIGATIGSLTLSWSFGGDILSLMVIWWRSDFSGMLLLGSVLLVFRPFTLNDLGQRRQLIMAVFFTFCGLAIWCLGFVYSDPILALFVAPFLIWTAMRFPTALVAIIVFGLSLLTCLLLVLGFNPLSAETWDWEQQVQILQIFLVISMLTAVGLSLVHNQLQYTQNKLRKALANVESANAVKQEFLRTVSHELRTPLNGISGAIQLLQQPQDKASIEQYVQMAKASTDHMTSLINDILSFTEIQAGSLKIRTSPTQLIDWMTHITEAFSTYNQPSVTFTSSYASDLPACVMIDRQRLASVIHHVLGNAYMYTDSGTIALNVSYKREALHIVVTDTGCGIEPEAQAMIWQLFRQRDGAFNRQHGGLGMGLPLSKKLLELMGGSISMASIPNQGSTFVLEVPALIAPLTDIEIQTDKWVCHCTVLVVEDNDVNRLVLQRLLESMTCQVFCCDNGLQAVEFMQNNRQPDLILMDCQMPVMDGFMAAQKIRRLSHGRDIPIIAVTANMSDSVHQDCVQAGMNDLLAKPVDIGRLSTLLRRYLSSVE